jgi:hypothetical protein
MEATLLTSAIRSPTYYDRSGRQISSERWSRLRHPQSADYAHLAYWHNCRQAVEASWAGEGPPCAPRHIFQIAIYGGRFDGQRLCASSEDATMAWFDHTVAALKAHQGPIWTTPMDTVTAGGT